MFFLGFVKEYHMARKANSNLGSYLVLSMTQGSIINLYVGTSIEKILNTKSS